jgi:ribosomal protein S18 acetylase RimI-like enzyme
VEDRRPVEHRPVDAGRVIGLELLAARTWRGTEEERFGDWLLRAAGGFTGRANSVLVTGRPQVPVPGAEEADAALAAAGWERSEDVLVLTAPLAGWPPPRVPVALADEPDDAWLTGYRYRGTPLPPIARQVLMAAERPVFASVRLRPAPAPLAAVARGVVADRRLFVTAVTVDEGARRRGLATAVMAALGAWGRNSGAGACVLQVAADNAPALALYDRLGFTEHHRYHYRLAG